MNITAPTTSAALPVQPAVATAARAGQPGAQPLGATALPGPGPSQDALVAALRQLVQTLSALIAAMQGAAAIGSGPGQLPTQSPIQAPTQGGGPGGPVAGGGAPAAPTAGVPAAAGAPAAALQPVAADYRGPHMAAEPMGTGRYTTALNSGASSFAELGGRDAGLHFFGRYGSTSAGLGTNTVHLRGTNVPAGTLVQLPDAGSATLSSGATFSWSTRTVPGNGSMLGGEMAFSVARGGAQLPFDGASVDRVAGFGDRVASPLSATEMNELASQLASRYPAAPR